MAFSIQLNLSRAGQLPDLMFTKITTQSELPAGNQAREFPCGSKVVCVANVMGAIIAMENICLHRGGPLGQGTVEDGKLVCPWHGWRWDPQTGAAVHNPNARLTVYPIKIESGDVMIDV